MRREEEVARMRSAPVILDVGRLVAPIISSRDVLNSLVAEIDKHPYVVLDFQNVEFVSRSAAHKIVMYILKHPEKRIEFRNMNESVQKMLEIVRQQISSGRAVRRAEDFKVAELVL